MLYFLVYVMFIRNTDCKLYQKAMKLALVNPIISNTQEGFLHFSNGILPNQIAQRKFNNSDDQQTSASTLCRNRASI